SILYMAGFWSFFNINVLQFIELKDILKSVAIPLGSGLIIYATTVILYNYNIPDEETRKNYLNEGGVFKGLIYFIYFMGLICMVGFAAGIIKDIFFDEPQYKLRGYVSTLSILVIYLLITKTNFLSESGHHRNWIIPIICFLPLASLTKGLSDGKDIHDGKGTYIVISDTACITNGAKYRYISTLSDKAFALSLADDSICVFKYNYLRFTKEKNP
ncbi:hypothetical protein ACM45N_003645, partial [Cronobacter sakazakii]